MDKSKPEAKPSDAKRQYHSREFKIEAVRQLEEGKISLGMEWIDLTEVMDHVIQNVEPKAKSKGLAIRVEQEDQLPLVYADGLRMGQVFMNLLDNAIRYTEKGTIQVAFQLKSGQVVTVVEDSGIGIPLEEVPSVFERFYRVEKSRSREHGGTGLGLAIVKQLVDMQGGTIQVASVLGKGTRFEIALPIGEDNL